MLGLTLYYYCFENPQVIQGVQVLQEGWQYQTASMEAPLAVEKLEDYIALEPSEVITMTRVMQESSQNPGIVVFCDHQWIRVLLGEQELLSNTLEPRGENPGVSVHVIPLPADYLGQTLSVTAESPYALYAASPDPIYFGSVPALYAWINASSARGVLVAFSLAFSGLVFMLFALNGCLQKKIPSFDQVSFGLFSVLLGVNTLSATSLAYQLFPPEVSSALQLAACYLFPLPLLYFLYTRCKATRKVTLAAGLVFALSVAVTFGAALLGAWDLPYARLYMNPAMIVLVVYVMGAIALECLKKNRALQMLAPAIGLIFASAVLSAIDIMKFFWVKEWLRIAGLLLLSLLVWADVMRTQAQSRRKEMWEMQLLRMKTTAIAERQAAALACIEETKLLHHEFRHHLSALQMLGRQGDLPKVQEYLDQLVQEDQSAPGQFCEHMLVNAILTKTSWDCRRENVRFLCEAYVPAALSVPESSLAGLLFNLLENAVLAASQAAGENRFIQLYLRLQESFLVVSCSNGMAPGSIRKKGSRFLSTKPDALQHGVGIKIMQHIVEEYGSRLHIQHSDTRFTVKTILRLMADAS